VKKLVLQESQDLAGRKYLGLAELVIWNHHVVNKNMFFQQAPGGEECLGLTELITSINHIVNIRIYSTSQYH
jgi:hypothetical protein